MFEKMKLINKVKNEKLSFSERLEAGKELIPIMPESAQRALVVQLDDKLKTLKEYSIQDELIFKKVGNALYLNYQIWNVMQDLSDNILSLLSGTISKYSETLYIFVDKLECNVKIKKHYYDSVSDKYVFKIYPNTYDVTPEFKDNEEFSKYEVFYVFDQDKFFVVKRNVFLERTSDKKVAFSSFNECMKKQKLAKIRVKDKIVFVKNAVLNSYGFEITIHN